MVCVDASPKRKADGARSWPRTSKNERSYTSNPNTSSWNWYCNHTIRRDAPGQHPQRGGEDNRSECPVMTHNLGRLSTVTERTSQYRPCHFLSKPATVYNIICIMTSTDCYTKHLSSSYWALHSDSIIGLYAATMSSALRRAVWRY